MTSTTHANVNVDIDITPLLPLIHRNLNETPTILTQHLNDGSTSSSVLLASSDTAEALDRSECPSFPAYTIRVLNTDSLSAAMEILGAGSSGNGSGGGDAGEDAGTNNAKVGKSASNNTVEDDDDDDEEFDPAQGADIDFLSDGADSSGGGKTIVLSSCSDEHPGGVYSQLVSRARNPTHDSTATTPTGITQDLILSLRQETSLCLCTTLYSTLNPSWYPWKTDAASENNSTIKAIYSPGVVIFRDPSTLQELPYSSRRVISILSLAAPHNPHLTTTTFTNPKDLHRLQSQIRFWLRTAAKNGQERLVLGAWGCGSHGCPPGVVAGEMKRVLGEEEFKGWFREVVFAVRDGAVGSGTEGKKGNWEVFREVLDGVVVG